MAKVDLVLNADLKKATKNISGFSKSSAASLEGLKGSFGTLAKLAGVVAGAFAFKKVVESAAKQEQAVRSLNTALAITGDFTEETSKNFQEFASELQRNSTVGDEVSLSLVGLAKSMGATNHQTKQVIQAAVDLSAVTGESLETSVRNLTKTLGGMKGELGETQPEIRNLTKEQLINGEALDVLAKKYKGSAKELTKTFGGALDQTKNSFGDLLEEIGFLITENPVIIKAINLMSKGFNRLGEIVNENKITIIDFAIDGVVSTVKAVGFLIEAISDTVVIFKNFEAVVDLGILKLAEFADTLLEIGNVIGPKFANSLIRVFKKTINLGLAPILFPIKNISESLAALGIISDETNDKIQNLGTDVSANFKELKSTVERFTVAAREGFIESAEKLIETKDGFAKAAESVALFAEELEALKKVSKDTNETLQKLSDTNKDLKKNTVIPFAERKFGKVAGKDVTGASILSGAGSFASGLGKGASGLNELASGGLAAASNLLLPGLGAVVGPLTQLLGQGPEVAKRTVEAFIDQIPVLIDAIAEAMPVVAETLAENMDKIIIALVKGVPKITQALVLELPKALVKGIATAIEKNIPIPLTKAFKEAGKLFSNAFKGVLEALKKIFVSIYIELPKKIFEGLKKIFSTLFTEIFQSLKGMLNIFSTLFTEIFNTLKEAFKSFFLDLPKKLIEAFVNGIREAFKQVGNIGGNIAKSVGGFIGGIGKSIGGALGFAEGGEVPPGFPNDSFPAPRLSSGENVIDRSTNEKLNEFLDSGISTNIILQVGEKQLADVLLNLNRQGFRVA